MMGQWIADHLLRTHLCPSMCLSDCWDSAPQELGIPLRMMLGEGRDWSLVLAWQGTAPRHISHGPATCRSTLQTRLETAPGFCCYSLLLLLTHVRTQKMSVGMGITGSLPLRDVTHSMNVLLLFAVVCLSVLLSLSAEPIRKANTQAVT